MVQVVGPLGTTVFFCINLSRNNRSQKIFVRLILIIRNILLALSACRLVLHLLLTVHGLPFSSPHLNATRILLGQHNRAPLHLNDHRVRTPMKRVAPQTLKLAGIVEVHQVSTIVSGSVVEGIAANTLALRHNNNIILHVLHRRIGPIARGRRLIQHIRHGNIGILSHRVGHQLIRVRLLIMIMDIGGMIRVTMDEMRGLSEAMCRRKV
jgi:hypothetical protein